MVVVGKDRFGRWASNREAADIGPTTRCPNEAGETPVCDLVRTATVVYLLVLLQPSLSSSTPLLFSADCYLA